MGAVLIVFEAADLRDLRVDTPVVLDQNAGGLPTSTQRFTTAMHRHPARRSSRRIVGSYNDLQDLYCIDRWKKKYIQTGISNRGTLSPPTSSCSDAVAGSGGGERPPTVLYLPRCGGRILTTEHSQYRSTPRLANVS